jgi:hypothetical protein
MAQSARPLPSFALNCRARACTSCILLSACSGKSGTRSAISQESSSALTLPFSSRRKACCASWVAATTSRLRRSKAERNSRTMRAIPVIAKFTQTGTAEPRFLKRTSARSGSASSRNWSRMTAENSSVVRRATAACKSVHSSTGSLVACCNGSVQAFASLRHEISRIMPMKNARREPTLVD